MAQITKYKIISMNIQFVISFIQHQRAYCLGVIVNAIESNVGCRHSSEHIREWIVFVNSFLSVSLNRNSIECHILWSPSTIIELAKFRARHKFWCPLDRPSNRKLTVSMWIRCRWRVDELECGNSIMRWAWVFQVCSRKTDLKDLILIAPTKIQLHRHLVRVHRTSTKSNCHNYFAIWFQ